MKKNSSNNAILAWVENIVKEVEIRERRNRQLMEDDYSTHDYDAISWLARRRNHHDQRMQMWENAE